MLALRNLARRRMRTTLTVLGVSVGIAAVVSLVAVARGIRSQFNDFFAAGEAHLVLTRAGAADPFISYLPDELLGELRRVQGVAQVYPFLFAAKQVPGQPFFFLYGTTEGSPILDRLRVTEGRGPFEASGQTRPICVGRRIAEFLGLRVDAPFDLDGEAFEIVGIFESQVPLLESGGVLPFRDAQRVSGLQGRMSQALVRLDRFDADTLAAVRARIEAAFPEVRAASPAEFSHAFDEFNLMDQAVTVFTVLAVLVGGIGVMNTMLMSVFERTREIGILRAVGWSRGMILREVLLEGLLVCLLAGPLGLGLGVLTLEGLARIAELGFIVGDYSPIIFAEALAVGIGMGFVGAVYPALRAVRIMPVEALRYE